MSRVHQTEKLIVKLGFAGLGWMGGLFAAAFMGNALSAGILAAVTIVAAVFLLNGAKYSRFALLISAAALAGSLYLTGYEHFYAKPLRQLDGQEITVVGTVTDTVQVNGKKDRLTVSGKTSDGRRVKTTVYSENYTVKAGDRIEAQFTAYVPENTPLYNGEDRAAANGIFIVSKDTAQVTRLGVSSYPIRHITKLRRFTTDRIRRRCSGQAGAFIISILCADKSFVSTGTKNVVYRSGMGHIFAVSGTHIVILSSFILRVLRVLVRPKKLRSGVMIVILAAFAVFAGCSPSVIRACILSGFGYLAVFFRRQNSAPNSLGAAAILITLACPYSAFSASFLLSFSAAAAINVIYPVMKDKSSDKKIYAGSVACLIIFVLNFPFAAYFFSEIPLFFAAANLMLLPVCTIALSCAFLFMLTGCWFVPAIDLSELLAAFVIKCCKMLSSLPFSYTGACYRTQLIAAGTAAVIFVIYTAITAKDKRRCSALCVTAALVLCSTASVISLVKPHDSITIVPDSRGYTAELVADGKLMIFDMASTGRGRYHAEQTAKELKAESVLFIEKNIYQTQIAYHRQMPELKEVFAPGGHGRIHPMNGPVTFSTADITYNSGYVITLNGHSLTLAKDYIMIDGRQYDHDGFYDISRFSL